MTLSTLFSQIISISKATLSNGDYFFYDTGSAPLSILTTYDFDASFKRVQLLLKPAAGVQFELRFRYKINPLIDNSQSPPPAVRPDYLVSYALEKFYKHQDQFQKAQLMRAEAQQVLTDETNKEEQFSEFHSVIAPLVEDDPDE